MHVIYQQVYISEKTCQVLIFYKILKCLIFKLSKGDRKDFKI